jgi:hypothetical protein
LTFPIGLDSTLAPDGDSGVVKLEGAVELLKLGTAQYFWRELWVEPGSSAVSSVTDLEPSPPQAGISPQGDLMTLPSERGVTATASNRTIEVSAQPAGLSPATAAALNAAFAEGHPTFAPGERLGTASFVATAE